jgi:hypothetical protein
MIDSWHELSVGIKPRYQYRRIIASTLAVAIQHPSDDAGIGCHQSGIIA